MDNTRYLNLLKTLIPDCHQTRSPQSPIDYHTLALKQIKDTRYVILDLPYFIECQRVNTYSALINEIVKFVLSMFEYRDNLLGVIFAGDMKNTCSFFNRSDVMPYDPNNDVIALNLYMSDYESDCRMVVDAYNLVYTRIIKGVLDRLCKELDPASDRCVYSVFPLFDSVPNGIIQGKNGDGQFQWEYATMIFGMQCYDDFSVQLSLLLTRNYFKSGMMEIHTGLDRDNTIDVINALLLHFADNPSRDLVVVNMTDKIDLTTLKNTKKKTYDILVKMIRGFVYLSSLVFDTRRGDGIFCKTPHSDAIEAVIIGALQEMVFESPFFDYIVKVTEDRVWINKREIESRLLRIFQAYVELIMGDGQLLENWENHSSQKGAPIFYPSHLSRRQAKNLFEAEPSIQFKHVSEIEVYVSNAKRQKIDPAIDIDTINILNSREKFIPKDPKFVKEANVPFIGNLDKFSINERIASFAYMLCRWNLFVNTAHISNAGQKKPMVKLATGADGNIVKVMNYWNIDQVNFMHLAIPNKSNKDFLDFLLADNVEIFRKFSVMAKVEDEFPNFYKLEVYFKDINIENMSLNHNRMAQALSEYVAENTDPEDPDRQQMLMKSAESVTNAFVTVTRMFADKVIFLNDVYPNWQYRFSKAICDTRYIQPNANLCFLSLYGKIIMETYSDMFVLKNPSEFTGADDPNLLKNVIKTFPPTIRLPVNPALIIYELDTDEAERYFYCGANISKYMFPLEKNASTVGFAVNEQDIFVAAGSIHDYMMRTTQPIPTSRKCWSIDNDDVMSLSETALTEIPIDETLANQLVSLIPEVNEYANAVLNLKSSHMVWLSKNCGILRSIMENQWHGLIRWKIFQSCTGIRLPIQVVFETAVRKITERDMFWRTTKWSTSWIVAFLRHKYKNRSMKSLDAMEIYQTIFEYEKQLMTMGNILPTMADASIFLSFDTAVINVVFIDWPKKDVQNYIALAYSSVMEENNMVIAKNKSSFSVNIKQDNYTIYFYSISLIQ